MKNKNITKSRKSYLAYSAKYLLILFAICASIQIIAQAPEKINYQVVVRDATGNPVVTPTGSNSMKIDYRIQIGTSLTPPTASILCSNYSYGLATNSYGMLNIALDFSSCTIDWSTNNLAIYTKVYSTNGTTYGEGASPLQSVPYSIFSNQVNGYPKIDANSNYPNGNILTWDSNNKKWLAQANTGGTTLPNGTSNLQVLTWDATSSTWIAQVNDGFDLNTDNQDLSVSATELEISGGSNVLLSAIQDGYEANTDNQDLSVSATELEISGGSNVLLSAIQDGTGTDNQGLSVSATELEISGGSNVLLSAIQDGYEANTDNQTAAQVSVTSSGNLSSTDVQSALEELQGDINNSSNIWVKPNINPFQTNDAITQNNDGNIGIGVIELQPELPVPYQDVYAPAEKLEVNGNIRINNIGNSGTTTENSYLEIINDDQNTGTFTGITLTNNTSNMATVSNAGDNMFQIVHEKNSDGTVNPLLLEDPQNEFKIRRDINYFNTTGTPATYEDFITIEGSDHEIGIMTNNPHATLSIGGNSSGNGAANVAIGQNYAVYNPNSPDNETASSIPVNSLIVEGKIGIGTMEPTSKLEVAGATRIGSAYAGATISTVPSNGLIVEGTVGIGKNNPNANYMLDVAGKTNLTSNDAIGGALKIENVATQTSGDLVFISGTTGQNSLNVDVGNTNLGGELDVLSDVRINTNKFTISGTSGNTAIGGTLDVTGATSLSSTLDVTGATSLSSTLDVTGATGIDGDFDINNNKFTVNATTGNTTIAGDMYLTGAIYDANNQSGTSGQVLSTTSSGTDWIDGSDLGLGDITEVVAGDGLVNGGTTGSVTLNVGAGTGIDVSTTQVSVDVSDFMSNGTNNELITATGTDAMISEANLTFDGSTLNVTGDIVASGTLNTTGIEELSDKRWKKDVVEIEDALEKVMSMNGVYYNWRKDEFPEKGFTDNKQVGFIAQELEDIFPEVVNTDDQGYKSVMYGHVVALLVEAIKELESQLDQKTTKLEEKAKEIDEIKASLEEIQNILGIKKETVNK